jgi:hypothetical protein
VKVLRISVSKGETKATLCVKRGKKVTRGGTKLINDELHYFYSSIIIIMHINQRERVMREM